MKAAARVFAKFIRLYFNTGEKITFITIFGSFLLYCEDPWKTFPRVSGYPVERKPCLCIYCVSYCTMFGFHKIKMITIFIFCHLQLVFPRNFQHGSTGLEETTGEINFNYTNIKIIKSGWTSDRFDESLDCFSIFTSCQQIKFQIMFSNRITTFKQIITLHSKT